MATLNDVCQGMHQTLAHIQVRCDALGSSLAAFEDHVSMYPATKLSHRLLGLATWIAASTVSLYDQHGGEGHVCVFLSAGEGTTLHWVENEKIVADRAHFQSRGFTVLSPPEVMDLITDMIHESTSGGWEKVVEWLNKYGKSPGVDFSKVSRIPLLPP